MRLPFLLVKHTPRLTMVLVCLGLMTGCQSFNTVSTTVHLRVIDLSADAGSLDMYQNGHAIAYNLAYGTVTSYIALGPGTSTTIAAPTGSRQTLSSAKTSFAPGGQYTLVIHSPLAALQQSVLKDTSNPTESSIRIIHQAERTGPVDVYLVPARGRTSSTAPIALHLASGATTDYLPVREGMAAIMVLPAGVPLSAASLALHT